MMVCDVAASKPALVVMYSARSNPTPVAPLAANCWRSRSSSAL
jgi:hypothetical protein